YEIAKRDSALKKISTRYRAFSYNHQEFAIVQNALALARIGKFFSPQSTNRYIAASEPALKEALELHLQTCKTVLGDEEFDKTIAEGGPMPTASDPCPLHNRSLSGLTVLTYMIMNHELADGFKEKTGCDCGSLYCM
ncbi:MAG TPA: hypothetical protein VGV15_02430, partial [Terriglobales bacterium]|nr:hypothetical protein [Terriglobales bacterium]